MATIFPPSQVIQSDYSNWLKQISLADNPFIDLLFRWHDEQLSTQLPRNIDVNKAHVTVDRARSEIGALEQAGIVETGTGMGFESVALVTVPLSISLETLLFYCGKPVGLREGETYPVPSQTFSFHHCKIQEKWGENNYLSTETQIGMGPVRSLHDDHAVLVRGTPNEGYTLYGSFLGPTPNFTTATLTAGFVIMLRPQSDDDTEIRHILRRSGQSYKQFGLEYGRRQFGFNMMMFQGTEKAVIESMMELKSKGNISERRPAAASGRIRVG